jgi:hypothetical protein
MAREAINLNQAKSFTLSMIAQVLFQILAKVPLKRQIKRSFGVKMKMP